MVDTKSNEQTQANWEGAIGRVPAAYTAGVNNAKDVIAKGVAAEDLYAEKLQASIASKKRARELGKVSDEDWKNATRSKGAARIGPGMTAAKSDYREGMGVVLDTIRSVSIPKRTADPMANIDNRVKPIVAALHKLSE